MTAIDFVGSILAGAGASVVASLWLIPKRLGEYQERIRLMGVQIDRQQKSIDELNENFTELLRSVGNIEGQLMRMNGGRHG